MEYTVSSPDDEGVTQLEIQRHPLKVSETFFWKVPRCNARVLGRAGAVTRLRTPTPVVDEFFLRRFGGGGGAAERFWVRRFMGGGASSASDQTIFSPSVTP